MQFKTELYCKHNLKGDISRIFLYFNIILYFNYFISSYSVKLRHLFDVSLTAYLIHFKIFHSLNFLSPDLSMPSMCINIVPSIFPLCPQCCYTQTEIKVSLNLEYSYFTFIYTRFETYFRSFFLNVLLLDVIAPCNREIHTSFIIYLIILYNKKILCSVYLTYLRDLTFQKSFEQ